MLNLTRRDFGLSLGAGLLAGSAGVAGFTLTGCNTTWIVDLETYLPVAVGGVTGIITILVSAGALGPVLPAEIAAVTAAITAGLNLLCGAPVNGQCNPSSLIGQYNSAPGTSILQKIQAELAGVQANLTSLLNLVHIKNAILQATIGSAISLILTTISAIAARVTKVASVMLTSGTGAAAQAVNKLPKMTLSPKQVKDQFNQLVISAGYQNAVIP